MESKLFHPNPLYTHSHHTTDAHVHAQMPTHIYTCGELSSLFSLMSVSNKIMYESMVRIPYTY